MPKIPVNVIAIYIADCSAVSHIPASKSLAAKYKVMPLRILTPNGEKIIIDRIEDIRREASVKAGCLGDKYTCKATFGYIQKEIYLYKDEDSWFMEEEF